jgi:hypothetical protein
MGTKQSIGGSREIQERYCRAEKAAEKEVVRAYEEAQNQELPW